MAETQRAGADQEKRHEAENLAKEAIEEFEHGNKDEGKFLAEEARELDPKAAEAVLKGEEQQGRAKSSGHSSAHKGNEKPGRGRGHAAEKSGARGHEKLGGSALRTIDHDEIRAWIEQRNGRPSVVKRSHNAPEGGGILRIDFNEPEQSLEEVPWDEFFETFEDRKLAFLHQDRTAEGQVSRFFKFVRRDAEAEAEAAA